MKVLVGLRIHRRQQNTTQSLDALKKQLFDMVDHALHVAAACCTYADAVAIAFDGSDSGLTTALLDRAGAQVACLNIKTHT